MRFILLIVAGTLAAGCSRRSDPPSRGRDASLPTYDEPSDIREYHGEPSSVLCGVRWSHDHTSVHCEGARLSLKALAPFKNLHHLTLTNVTIEETNSGSVPRFERVRDLSLGDVRGDASVLIAAFPNVEFLSLSHTSMSVADLRGFSQLRSVILHRADAPDAATLLAFPKLESVSLAYLRCPERRCEFELGWELEKAQPDLEVRVMGRELNPKPNPIAPRFDAGAE